MTRPERAAARVDRATARAIAEVERELARIQADYDQGRLTRREYELEYDRAIAGWARESPPGPARLRAAAQE